MRNASGAVRTRVGVAVLMVMVLGLATSVSAAAVTLKVWTWRSAEDQSIGYDHQMERFQKQYPDIKIELERVPWDQYWNKLVPSIMAGTGPDVMLGHAGQTTQFSREGVWEPIPESVFSNAWIEENFYLSARQPWLRNGRYYGLPDESEGHGLFYNVDQLKEAGLDAGSPPRTWEELRKAAVKLTKRDQTGKITRAGYTVMIPDNDFQVTWYTMLMQLGGSVVKDGKCALDSPQGLESLRYFVDLVRKDQVDAVGQPDPWDAFRDGKASMIMTEPAYQSIWYLTAPKLNFLIAHVPTVKAGETPIWADIGRWSWVVSTRSKHKAEAWTLFKYLNETGERVLRRLDPVYLLTYPPAMKAEAEDPRVKAFVADKPMVRIWYDISKDGRWVGDVTNYTRFIRVVGPELAKIWYQNADAEPTLKRINEAVNKFFAE